MARLEVPTAEVEASARAVLAVSVYAFAESKLFSDLKGVESFLLNELLSIAFAVVVSALVSQFLWRRLTYSVEWRYINEVVRGPSYQFDYRLDRLERILTMEIRRGGWSVVGWATRRILAKAEAVFIVDYHPSGSLKVTVDDCPEGSNIRVDPAGRVLLPLGTEGVSGTVTTVDLGHKIIGSPARRSCDIRYAVTQPAGNDGFLPKSARRLIKIEPNLSEITIIRDSS